MASCKLIVAALVVVVAVFIGVLYRAGCPEELISQHNKLGDTHKPYRPALLCIANGFGNIFGGDIVSLHPDSLKYWACIVEYDHKRCDSHLKRKSLGELWGNNLDEGLEQLLRSLTFDAELSFIGRLVAKGQIEMLLRARIRLMRYAIQHFAPLGAQDLTGVTLPVEIKPVVIYGIPRSGTTFLFNLLSQDKERFQFASNWEYSHPNPELQSRASYSANATEELYRWIKFAESRLHEYTQLVPDFGNMHALDARLPEECTVSMGMEFDSWMFGTTFNVPGYMQWATERSSHKDTIEWHKFVLQILQHSRDDEREQPRAWILKSPWFLVTLPDLLKTYPNAVLIQTHRKPTASLASISSVVTKLTGGSSDVIDKEKIGGEQYKILHDVLKQGLKGRKYHEDLPEKNKQKIIDVYHSDLITDPMSVVKSIYKSAGWILSPNVEDNMRTWLLSNKKIKYGHHKYTMQEYGLDASQIMKHDKVFQEYCSTYNLTCTS
eukprot:m.77416 g.77416  ORF g.77416 m.77416 type:complete len:493 (+) comp12621_c0_seq3:83-1561(+)